MTLSSSTLPNNILRRMAKKDRPTGNAGLTTIEASEKQAKKAERIIHNEIINLLNQRGIFFNRFRMDKRPPWPGWPDFTIFLPNGLAMLVEVKTDTGKMKEDQIQVCGDYMAKTCNTFFVVRSLAEFRAVLEGELQRKEV